MRNWKNQKFLLCKLDYSAISGYFFPIFQTIKRIYEIFRLLFPLLWVYFVLNHNGSFSSSKPFMHQFVHFSPTSNISVQIHFSPRYSDDLTVTVKILTEILWKDFLLIIKLLYFMHSSAWRQVICSY